MLNGAAFTSEVVDFTADTESPTNTGQFVAAISISAFAEVADFKAEVDAHLRRLKASATLPGRDPVRIPGDGRETVYRERCERGIPLHPNLVQTLSAIAQELGVAPPS